MIEFIRYEEVYAILHEKYKVTHDELLYWIHSHTSGMFNRLSDFMNAHEIEDEKVDRPLLCFTSDIESNVKYHKGYMYANCNFAYPYGFFVKDHVLSFVPPLETRLISINSLHDRFWKTWDRLEKERFSPFPSLDMAAHNGILHFYDDYQRKFTTHCEYLGNMKRAEPILWINTDIGRAKLSDPNTLFLKYHIIQIERTFERRSREDCMRELRYENEVLENE